MDSLLGVAFLAALIAMVLIPVLSSTEAGAWAGFGTALIALYSVWRIADTLATNQMWWQDTQITLPSIVIATAAGLLAIGWTRSREENGSAA